MCEQGQGGRDGNLSFLQAEISIGSGLKSHMKWCAPYETEKTKKVAVLGSLPKAATTPAAASDLSAPLREFEKAMNGLSTKQHAQWAPQQRRREIVQAAKTEVIDRYRTPVGQVTASMRGAAKLAIERELASLPLEELPFEGVLEIAAAIRDSCYTPGFIRQARKASRQGVEEERRHQKEAEALGALLRADCRRKILIQQASLQAQASCEEKAITGWAHRSVVGDIKSRLAALLTGDEPILEAQAIVRAVMDARFAEAEAKQEAARANATERWYEGVAAVLILGTVLAAPLLALKYPAQTLAIISWLERAFGLPTGAEAAAPTPAAAAPTPPAASAEARPPTGRRRKDPDAPLSHESPWGNAVGAEPVTRRSRHPVRRQRPSTPLARVGAWTPSTAEHNPERGG